MEKLRPSGKTKLANGILRKQPKNINNNSIVKNLNEKVKKISPGKLSPIKRVSPPGGGAPLLPQGCTPLMYACQQADHRLVADILKKEPLSVIKKDRTLKTALHYCFDNPTAVTADKVLMAAPALLEARDQDGFTPLHLAVIQGNMPLVTFLLANNADVMALDNEKHSVVHWATVCGELEALRAVLSAGADASTADVHGGFPLHYAAQMCGSRSGAGGNNSRALDVLKALLRVSAARVDAQDGDGRQPLLWAASAGSAPAMLALVKAGAEVEAPDKDGLTALHCAASRGHTECIETLLTLCGARPDVIDSNGCTALHYAVTLGHADATALLLDQGADPNRQDRKGRSPAHCGCAKGQFETQCPISPEMMRLCFSSHASKPYVGNTFSSPFSSLPKPRHPGDTVMFVIVTQGAPGRGYLDLGHCWKHNKSFIGARNANVWLRNARGDLPLHEAVASGRRELVKWLLEMRPSQINATNNDGRTLLHIAANTDNTDLCKILLDFGAQVNAVLRTSKNILMTPLDCALHRGFRSTAKYLQMHGGLPASRLSSRQVFVDQETVPQLPVRHIKSTKISLQDKIAIEKREVFEMSPRSTPKHSQNKYSSKVETLSDSSDYTSEDYELQNKRFREERRKQKKQRHKKERMKSKQSSYSDGDESEHRKRSSRRNHRALSDSESSEKRSKRNNKRSKSDPVSKSRSESRHRETESPRRHKHRKSRDKSSESEYDNKHKKRRRKSVSRKSNKTESESSDRSEKVSEKEKKISKKEKIIVLKQDEPAVEHQYAEELAMLKQATEIVQHIDNGTSQKDAISENQPSESETVSLINTTLVTEAQIHADGHTGLDRELIISIVQEKYESENDDKFKDATSDADKFEPVENIDEKGSPDESHILIVDGNQAITLIEHHAEILEERIDSEAVGEDLEPSKRECIIAIIPDIQGSVDTETQDETPLDNDSVMQEEQEAVVENEVIKEDEERINTEVKPATDFVQAIIGILPDEESKAIAIIQEESEGSPDSIMGEPVIVEAPYDDVNQRALTLIDEELSDHPATESKSFKSYSPDHQAHPFTQQDSEETTAGISEISLKSVTGIQRRNSPDVSEMNEEDQEEVVQETKIRVGRAKPKGVTQKRLPDVKTQRPTNKKKPQPDSQRNKPTDRDAKNKIKPQLYQTQSYKILGDGDTNNLDDQNDREMMKEHVQTLMQETEPNIDYDEPDRFVKQAGYTRRRIPSISDNEIYNIVDSAGNVRRRRLKKKYRDKSRNGSMRSKSQNSDRDYESSGMMDSGFEPSPRFIHQNRVMSPRLVAYYEDRNATGLYSGKLESKIPKRKPGDKNAVDMATVTQIVQTNMRRYFLERKIFQHLMDLKRIQIRSGKANEAVLVKRAIDEYHKSSLAYVGAGRYTSTDFTFKTFEKFLYETLRRLQRSGVKNLVNMPERAFPDFEGKLENSYKMDALPDNPILCTSKTHRCYHAVHAYTGIPCSAYIPAKHHVMPKPAPLKKGFLPQISSKGKPQNSQVTLELCHGNEKQMIALPSEKLDKNKRYYVTFTVKGSSPNSDNENPKKNQPDTSNTHRNVKSV